MSITQKLRKAIASIASVAVLTAMVTIAPQASAQTFDDVPQSHWAYAFVEQLVEDGVIDANDNYRPDDNLNRAELVKIAIEATTGIQSDLIPESPTFDDVPTTVWYYEYVETAAALGIVAGYNDASGNPTGNFGPGDTVNRAAATKILVNAYGIPTTLDPDAPFVDVDSDAWFYDFVTTAYNQSIIDGYKDADGELTGYFGPGDPVTRAQVAKLSVNSANPVVRTAVVEEEEDTPTPVGDIVEGDLEVSLSSDSLEATTVPKSANVAVASFDLTAGEEDILVTSLMFVRGGIGANTLLGSAVLKDQDGNRISKAKTINSDDEVTFTILGGGITIDAGTTQTVTIVLNTGTATGNHNFALVNADAVMTNAQDVIGDFPVKSNTFEVGSVAAGTLTISSDGNPADVKVGQTDAIIAKFKLESSNTEDISFTGITLKETGTANENNALANIKLLADGVEIAEGTLNDRYISFNLTDPLLFAKSKTKKFKVTADITGEPNKTLIIGLDNQIDIDGVGANYGFGIGVAGTYTSAAVNIQAGAISVTKTEPSDKFRKDIKNVVLGTVNVTVNSGDSVEMKAFNALITSTASGVLALLENVELYDEKTGSVYDLTADTAITTDTTVTFSDTDLGIALTSGQTRSFSLRADTINVTAGVAGQGLTVSFTGVGGANTTGGLTFQETVDDQYVTDVTPSALSFTTINGEASTATLSMITQSTAKNAVIGTKGVEVLKYELKAGAASNVVFDELTIEGTVVDNGTAGTAVADNTRINNVTLYKVEGSTTTELDAKSGSQFAAGKVTFDGFSEEIEASATVNYLVTVDVIDDENQALDTINFKITSISLNDDQSDDITTITVDGAAGKTATALTNEAVSTRTITVTGVGTLALAADTTDTETDKAKYVLGNTTSDFVASYELTATNEGIKIEDLQVVETSSLDATNYKKAISEVCLYKEDKTTQIACKSVIGKTTDFEDINYSVAEGAENIYVKVKANKMGKDAAGAVVEGITLQLHAIKANGSSSSKLIYGQAVTTTGAISTTNYVGTGSSLAFSTIPTRISNVEFVSSYGGVNVSSTLTNGQNNVAILKITTDASSNTKVADGSSLKTVLKALRLSVESDAKGATTGALALVNAANSGSIVVEKIGGTGINKEAALTSMTNVSPTEGLATVNLDSLDTNNIEIQNSTSVYYVVKASLANMSSTAQGYVQVKLKALDSTVGSANIEYKSSDILAGGIDNATNNRAALLLSTSSLDATKISSNY